MAGTLHLLCGLPGAGKTTLAYQLAIEHTALRLSSDEWLIELLAGPDRAVADPMRLRLEPLLLQVATRVLRLGGDVVLDFGQWFRSQRDISRSAARAVDARVELHVLNPPYQVLCDRVAARNSALGPASFPIAEAELADWVGMFEVPDADELALFDAHVIHGGDVSAGPVAG